MFLYHLFAKTTCNGKEFKFQGSHEDRSKKGNENNFTILKIARDLEEEPLIIELKRLLGNAK